eukprot:26746-Prorocentrum_minimum.AAC.2
MEDPIQSDPRRVVEHISKNYHMWNANNGRDHVFVMAPTFCGGNHSAGRHGANAKRPPELRLATLLSQVAPWDT